MKYIFKLQLIRRKKFKKHKQYNYSKYKQMYGDTPRINKSPEKLWVHTWVIITILYTSNSLLAATGKMLFHNNHKKC